MIINPLEVQLEKMKVSLEDIERDRQVDKGALTAKIDDLNLLNRELNESTKNLNSE